MAKMTPSAFISSTKEDLELYRTAAKDAAIQAGFQPVMMDYFAAQSEQPPYPACMAKVDPCDVVVVIVAHRYGWVPPDQPGQKDRSITWLECDHALKKKHKAEVLVFVVDEKCNWPLELDESYRITTAIKEHKATPELLADVQHNVGKLKEFKQWLNSLGFRGHFTAPDNLKSQVLAALYEWRDRHPQFRLAPGSLQQDPAQYLRWLREQTAWIDIRGLQVGSGKANRFPIGDLYIPLKTTGGEAGHLAGRTKHEVSGDRVSGDLGQSVLLEEALRHRRLVITGDPGSGKTTFLRRIAYELSRDVSQRALQLPQDGFPLLIRIAELEECIGNCRARQQAGAPNTKESPAWLAYFLEHRAQEWKWKLDAEFFEAKLSVKSTFMLLDGLDEAANQANRESMARLLENATQAYPNCQFVVTTRPGSYQGLATLEGFERVMIDDLQTEGIERFLHHWSQGLYPNDPGGAERHCKELLGALRARIEIRRMARNPVMLTALAVVHWNEKRLPEQRADLYDSIVTWLARSRQQRPGRERPERCLSLLGRLALAMQNQPQGRLVQVSLGQAAEMIAVEFHEIAPQERFAHAQTFLSQEEDDSGIVVSRGSELRFWHLTFQEFLAARAVSGLEEASQQELLLSGGQLYRAEWREVVLLLAGILLVKQGQDKVNGLFRAVLNQLDAKTSLANQAQCTGLLGAVLADLRPLAFQPIDPRYPTTLEAVLGIFDATKAKDIDLQVRLEAAEALGQAGDPRLRADHDNWVTIPAGSFLMGAQKHASTQPNYDSEADENESPVHEVRLAAFQVSRYPVTVEEYRGFMDDDGYQNKAWWKGGGFGERNQPDEWDDQLLHLNRPVVHVTWYEAAAWCAWAGVRLLTEAEWERAARGLEGRKYPWGNQEPDPELANYDQMKLKCPSPVGLFPRGMTPEGIHDLAGNVWEWVEDWYDERSYAKSPSANPTGPASGQDRVIRGGSCYEGSGYLRSSDRVWFGPRFGNFVIGFRCAREVFP
jgi:formylglycine-generating enzyme required for sulfatase activity